MEIVLKILPMFLAAFALYAGYQVGVSIYRLHQLHKELGQLREKLEKELES